jgi:iron complex transport system substrate-binding protein
MTTSTSTVRQRTARSLAAVVGAALLVSACGADDDDAGAATTAPATVATSPTPDPSTATTSGEVFPVTIRTAYGEITLDERPERIVALAGRHVELLGLLDEEPLAFTDYGATNDELLTSYPWMAGTLAGDADPSLFTADYAPAAEAIAALEPDLILTTIWQADEPMYEQLSQIAPTYVGIETDTNTSWQDDLAALAALTGHDTTIVDEQEAALDAALSSAAERLPGLQDATFYVAALGEGEQLWLTEYASAPLLALGLQPGDGQPLTGEEGADAPRFSQENIDQLTADVVFIAAENRDPSGEFRAALEADPRLAELPASANGTLIFLSPGQWNAVNGGSAASVQWWLEQIVPVLESSALNQRGQ